MVDLSHVITTLGGAAKTVELLRAGATKHLLASAVRSGLLVRPRKAWYVLPGAPRHLVAAVRVGGRATCVTALGGYGVWITDRPARPHVAVHRSACELRSAWRATTRQSTADDAVVHWVDTPRPREAILSRFVEPPARALADAIHCLEGDALLATVESALHLGVVDEDAWQAIVGRLPSARRRLLGMASARSESGLETYFVSRIRRLGIPYRQQVWIGADRVDVLLGDCLVVELDGRAFHDPHTDHVRDGRLILAGMRVLHFDYHQVLHDWASVQAVVLASLARGDHRRG